MNERYNFAENQARLQHQVDKMTEEELKDYFLKAYEGYHHARGGRVGGVDITTMGSGFPSDSVKFNLVRTRLEKMLSPRGEYRALISQAKDYHHQAE